MSDNCQIEICGGCCCACQFHVEDLEHCATNSQLREQTMRCICKEHKGYACIVQMQETGSIFSGWSKHGMCEMFLLKRTQDVSRKE